MSKSLTIIWSQSMIKSCGLRNPSSISKNVSNLDFWQNEIIYKKFFQGVLLIFLASQLHGLAFWLTRVVWKSLLNSYVRQYRLYLSIQFFSVSWKEEVFRKISRTKADLFYKVWHMPSSQPSATPLSRIVYDCVQKPISQQLWLFIALQELSSLLGPRCHPEYTTL